jgi:anti-sigma B factor antagonist
VPAEVWGLCSANYGSSRLGAAWEGESELFTVLKLPERVSGREIRLFAAKLNSELTHDRPRIIVDFSQVKQIDGYALDTILACMVEVTNRDGVIKLAGVSPQAATVLELTRMDRIFDLFPTVAEASSSYSVACADSAAENIEIEAVAMAEKPSPQPAAA